MAVPTPNQLASRPIGPLAPLLAAAGVGLLGATVAFGGAGWVPRCPIHAATGGWCPGCGMTRAVRHLVHGEFGAALGSNALLPLVLVASAGGWWLWWSTANGRPAPRWLLRHRTPLWVGALVATILFTVARNLSGTPFAALAP